MGVPAGPQLWFPFGAPNPAARMRLFCLPYAGGTASLYHSWWRPGPPGIDIVPVQLPGRGSRLAEEPEAHHERLVGQLTQALLPHVVGPFALFGHSMGALLAFELAHRLTRHGWAPRALFVAAYAAPHLPRARTDVHLLPRQQFRTELIRLGGTPEALLADSELFDICLSRLRADWAVVETYEYRPRPALDIDISAFAGSADPEVSIGELREWRDHTTRDFRMRVIDGDHFFIHRRGHVVLRHVLDDLRMGAWSSERDRSAADRHWRY